MLPFSHPEIRAMAAEIVASAETFEAILFVYGYEENGVILARGVAEKISENLIGQQSRGFRDHVGTYAKVVSIRMEDDNTAQTQGRVIAVCEVIPRQKHSTPYRPLNMEYK